jgi:outer membrane biosynthesis protein TonB
MAPMALDVGDLDVQYPRSGGKGKFLLAAVVLLSAGGFVAFQNRASLGLTPATAAAAVQAPAPPPPPPVSHAYDPGPPVKLGDSKPPLTLTTREPDKKETDVKKLDELKSDTKPDAKKVMASGKKPKAAPRTRRSAPSSKPAASGFKLGKSGSKYDPLNGSL